MLVMFTIIFLKDYIEDDKVVVVLGKNEGLDERKGQVCSSLEKEGEIPTSLEFKRPNLTTTIIVKLLANWVAVLKIGFVKEIDHWECYVLPPINTPFQKSSAKIRLQSLILKNNKKNEVENFEDWFNFLAK